MTSLSSLLVRDQIVGVRRIEEALQRQVVRGGDLETNLLELGAASEDVLAQYRARVEGLQPATAAEVMHPDPSAVALLTAELAERHRILPLRIDGTTLLCAVASPPLPKTLDELSFLLSIDFVPRIATELRLAAALAQAYGIPMAPRFERLAEKIGPVPAAGVAASHVVAVSPHKADTRAAALIGDKRGAPADLGADPAPEQVVVEVTAAPRDDESTQRVFVEPRPDTPLPKRRRRSVTPGIAAELLAAAGSRDEVLQVVLDVAHQTLDYVAIFVVADDSADGRASIGEGTPTAALHKISVPLREPSFLSTVRRSGAHYLGPIHDEGLSHRILSHLGRAPPANAVVMPVALRTRVVLLVYGDSGRQTTTGEDVADLLGLAPLVAAAFQRLILAKKTGYSPGPPGGPADREPRSRTPLPGPVESRTVKVAVVPPDPVAAAAPAESRWDEAAAAAPAPVPLVAESKTVQVSVPPPAARPPVADASPAAAAPEPPAPPPAMPIEPPASAVTSPGPKLMSKSPTRPMPSVSVPASLAETVDLPAGDEDEEGADGADPEVTVGEWNVGDGDEAFSTFPSGDDGEESVDGEEDLEDSARDTDPLLLPPPRISPPRQSPELGPVSGMTSGRPRTPHPDPVRVDIYHSPTPLPERPVPSVLVDMGPNIESLVDSVERGGEEGDLAAAALQKIGEASIPALVQRFPGPLLFDRHAAHTRLPRVGECGPLLRLLPSFRRPAVQYLLPLLGSTSGEVRFYATFLFSELQYPEAIPHLWPLLYDADHQTRILAIDVLKGFRRFPEFDDLAKDLRKNAWDASLPTTRRRVAVEAIGELRDAGAVAMLIELLGHEDAQLSELCWRALVLITRQDFGQAKKKWQAWLAKEGARHHIEWLIDALVHPSPELRLGASEELKRITREYFGYYYNLPRKDRERARKRYLEWWDRIGRTRFTGHRA